MTNYWDLKSKINPKNKINSIQTAKEIFTNEFERIKEAAIFADEIGLELHLGHGITFDSVKELSKIKEVKEFNIGHFIISESVFIGLQNSIKKFKEIIQEERKNL